MKTLIAKTRFDLNRRGWWWQHLNRSTFLSDNQVRELWELPPDVTTIWLTIWTLPGPNRYRAFVGGEREALACHLYGRSDTLCWFDGTLVRTLARHRAKSIYVGCEYE